MARYSRGGGAGMHTGFPFHAAFSAHRRRICAGLPTEINTRRRTFAA